MPWEPSKSMGVPYGRASRWRSVIWQDLEQHHGKSTELKTGRHGESWDSKPYLVIHPWSASRGYPTHGVAKPRPNISCGWISASTHCLPRHPQVINTTGLVVPWMSKSVVGYQTAYISPIIWFLPCFLLHIFISFPKRKQEPKGCSAKTKTKTKI